MHHAQGHPTDQAGCQRYQCGQEQVPHISLDVQVGDGHALVGPGVVAGEGGVLHSVLSDPGRTVDTGRVSTALRNNM